MHTQYRLGLDLGSNSIGWCALALEQDGKPSRLLAMGVRVYPDGRNPKDGSSLATQRRGPRSMRRNRDRYLQRRAKLLNALTRFGLMPEDAAKRARVAELDPYQLRAEALRRRLAPEELGRVLFHLNQHRGFKSNRRADLNSNESGLVSDAETRTRAELARSEHLTIGSWLAERHIARTGVRVRLAGSGKAAAYPFYPSREMVADEFDTLWAAQAGWNASLSDDIRGKLKEIIFFQRPLERPVVGRCWLEPDESRASRALPTAQRFRIAQSLAHLRLSRPGVPEAPLSDQQRAELAGPLYRGRDLTLDRVRTMLKLPAETDFNTRDDKLTGCPTAAKLGNGKKAAIGDTWHALSLQIQDAAIMALLESETDTQAIAALVQLGIPPAAAERAANSVLVDGHAALSAHAMSRILPHLEKGLVFSAAVQAAGYRHHSDRRTGEVRASLPYYGELLCQRMGTGTAKPDDPTEKRFGRAPNPTVHVALNEVRRVVNAIIAQHGPPTEIVVETLRDLGRSKKQREDYQKKQNADRAANDERRAMLAEMGVRVNGRNLMRLRLWQEQASDPKNRVCPYSGRLITARTAVSDEIQEDHILPFAVTLDDSAANRVLVTREANQAKARQSPFSAFGHTSEWPAIVERAALLPPQKRWRFQPDAMDKLAENADFLARQLGDSATIARWAKDYLEILAPERVWSIPGRLTAMLRDALGLNSATVLGKGGAFKDRKDHRHHAIDAVVVGLTDRGLLQRMTAAAKRADEAGRRLLLDLEAPWSGFVEQVAEHARSITVSYKPDTGWQNALHNDTAYGRIAGAAKAEPNVVVRRPLLALADKGVAAEKEAGPQDEDDGGRDAGRKVAITLRSDDSFVVRQIEAALRIKDKALRREALSEVKDAAGRSVRRIRTAERQDSVVEIRDRRTHAPYKYFKRDSNHRFELWRLPDGNLKWDVVSTFDAAREAEAVRLRMPLPPRRPHREAKRLIRLHKNDVVGTGTGAERRILVVKQLSVQGLTLAEHHEGGNLRNRDRDPGDPFKFVLVKSVMKFQELGLRKLWVRPDGSIVDPGPVA
jgi:CRISPR-associated endonuclease Csn1